MAGLLLALKPHAPPPRHLALGTTPRRDFLGAAFLATLATPLAASAKTDCFQECFQQCNSAAPGNKDYCKDNCKDYCKDGQKDGQKDGSGGDDDIAVARQAAGGDMGYGTIANKVLNPMDKEMKSVPAGADMPPSLPFSLGITEALQKRKEK
jgi:hypothetical protein